jgi:uncharacterized membrane protein YphA (DoxX/SURF4 family)
MVNDEPVTVRRVAVVPTGLIVALVLLRLATGWHFYREGTKKLTYDEATGDTRVSFSSEPFLRQAVGPWAEWFKRDLPNVHDWERLLVVPKRGPTTTEDLAKRSRWLGDYNKRRAEAQKAEKPAPIEFPPDAPYAAWAQKIDDDWQDLAAAFQGVDGLSDEQRAEAASALYRRRQQLADYLASQENSFADWQHELWRLGDWEDDPEAAELPFHDARIVEKRGETTAATGGWVDQVRALESSLTADLRSVLTAEQAANPDMAAKVDLALGDAQVRNLHRKDVAITCLIIGVGACLLLGLFTRLAALGGIAFLCMVIATQPPWVPGAVTTVFYYQLVEIAALGVLLASGAGRWAGLDFFLRAWWARRRAAV